eukprot:COSAG05_NODE_394_length_10383_cov_2.581389_6_plen_128_part_00
MNADSPETGVLLEQMVKNMLVCYPVKTSLVGAAILRVFDEKQTGKHKVPPPNIAAEKAKGTLAKLYGVSQALVDEYMNLDNLMASVHIIGDQTKCVGCSELFTVEAWDKSAGAVTLSHLSVEFALVE